MEAYVHDAVLDMLHARDELEAALDEVGEGQWERRVPYGERTLHELLAHVAGADQAWAVAAQGLLKGESETKAALTPEEAKAVRRRAIERGRGRPVEELRAEMASRRKLLLTLYEELEPRHLSVALRSYGDEHNAVRERIWLGYHDRLHTADVRRALRMTWQAPRLEFLPELGPSPPAPLPQGGEGSAIRAESPIEALSPDGALYVIYSVDPTAWELPSVVEGWSNRELLAHIATGDWVFQSRLRSLIEDGGLPAWPDVAAGNAERLAERRLTPVATLVEEYLSMRHETMLLLAQLTPRHLRVKMSMPWLGDAEDRAVVDYVRWFWMHERSHCEQLRPVMRYATARGGR